MDSSVLYWIKEGEQTKASSAIATFNESFNKKPFEFIFEVLLWLRNNFEYVPKEEKLELFRKRTAQEITISRKVCRCSDFAVLFRTLCIAAKIPAKYEEYILQDFLEKEGSNHYEGHVFVSIYINNKWYRVDPTAGNIGIGSPKAMMGGKKYVFLSEGLDSWDISIKDWESYTKAVSTFRKEWKLINN